MQLDITDLKSSFCNALCYAWYIFAIFWMELNEYGLKKNPVKYANLLQDGRPLRPEVRSLEYHA